MVSIEIDDKVYQAEEGETILQVAKKNKIHIPTLCYHPALKPSGSCKLCAVEVLGKTGKTVTMLSCILKVKDGMQVKTTGNMVVRARRNAFRRLIAMAPQSKRLRQMAAEENIDLGAPADGCIRCRLCIRVCKEIVGAGALKMTRRDGQSMVTPVPGHCLGCGTCATLCPTHVIKIVDENGTRTISIRDEVIGRQPLKKCEGCGKWYATASFSDLIEQRTAEHPHLKEHHSYCPTCAKLFSDRLKVMKKQTTKQQIVIR